jgi:hypothetical protein
VSCPQQLKAHELRDPKGIRVGGEGVAGIATRPVVELARRHGRVEDLEAVNTVIESTEVAELAPAREEATAQAIESPKLPEPVRSESAEQSEELVPVGKPAQPETSTANDRRTQRHGREARARSSWT